MKRIVFMLVAVLLIAGTFAGCAQDPAETTLHWNIGADPKTLDPSLNGASDGGDVINQTFEALVRERSGEVIPGIAESWETSEDGLTVTFHLRKSKWSDGSPLTAHDFEYGLKRGINPATASEYAWIWEYTNVVGAAEATSTGDLDSVGIKALDDYTLEIKLIAPTDYIVSLMAFYHFMPIKQEVAEAAGGEDGAWAKDPELAVSNGPFKLVSYTIGEGLRLEKNENYWNKKVVKLSAIEGKFIDEASTAYTAYQTGELHVLPDVPPAEVPKLIAEDPNYHIFPLLGTYYYNFNMDLDVWQDLKVRQAFALAIDRQLICETLGAGEMPALGMVPPGLPDHEGNDFFEKAGTYIFAPDASKVEEAQALLAEAGYPGGEGFPEFVLLYNTSESHKLVAEMVQEMFKTNLGITCTLENQEWAVFQDTRKEGDYVLARGGWLTDFLDPSGLLAIFQEGNAYNDPNYLSDEYNDTMKKALTATDKATHYNELYKAQDILMADLPIIPVYHYTDDYLVNDMVEGWDRSILGSIDFSTAELVN